jgi:CHAT domain-containing protein/Tfp pilus assembly protein PilF
MVSSSDKLSIFLRFLISLPLACLAVGAGAQTLDEARALHRANRWKEALEAYEAVVERLADKDPASLGIALNNSCVLLTELAEFQRALEICEAALKIRRSRPPGENRQLARTLNNLGRVLTDLGRLEEADSKFREALAINEMRNDAEAQAVNHSNLGIVAHLGGRYAQTIEELDAVVRLAEAHSEAPWSAVQTSIARLNYGVVLEKLGAHREALQLYEDLLAQADRLTPSQRATLEVNRGVLYRNLGDPQTALRAFDAASKTFENLGDLAGSSNAWLNRGLALHLNLGQLTAAEHAYRRALRDAQTSGSHGEELQDLVYLGRLLLEQGRLQEAQIFFERCLTAAKAGGSSEGQWSALEGLGRLAATRGDLPAASQFLTRAIEVIEGVRADLSPGVRRTGYFGDKQSVYAAAISVLVAQEVVEPTKHYGERALALVQQAKGRELLDALGGGEAPSWNLTALQKSLGDRDLLEYFIGQDQLFAWTVNSHGVKTFSLGNAKALLSRVTEVHRALAAGENPMEAHLLDLKRYLLEATDISPSDHRPLLIAPHGRLDYLPFEILPWGQSALIERRTITYLPSSSALLLHPSRTSSPSLTFLGFGNPQMAGPSSHFAHPAELVIQRFDLGPLPGAAQELETAARQLEGHHRLRLGKEATEDNFLLDVAAGSRVLHLATHSVIDDRPGRSTGIVLSPTASQDGLLTPEEIVRIPLSADLTVLAACRTALGTENDGRALNTLTGAFLAAGSRAVVASLWDVGDAATQALMEQFYFQLGHGRPPAEALRAAKRRLLATEGWEQPALWSGFILVGDGIPVQSHPRRWRYLAIACTIAAFLLFLFTLAKRLTKRKDPEIQNHRQKEKQAR